MAIELDVRDEAAVANAVSEVERTFGALHLAVNNAGTPSEATPVEDTPLEVRREAIETDVAGIFLCMKYEIPVLMRSAGGAIVNMSSRNGVVGVPQRAATPLRTTQSWD